MKKLIMLALVCLTAMSSFAQRHGGKVIEDSLNSDILGRNKKFCVYLPKSYDKETERNYPVLYLLHGLTNNYKTWRDLGNIGPIANQIINAGSANEMIIIMPDAGTEYDGYFNCGDKWRYACGSSGNSPRRYAPNGRLLFGRPGWAVTFGWAYLPPDLRSAPIIWGCPA